MPGRRGRGRGAGTRRGGRGAFRGQRNRHSIENEEQIETHTNTELSIETDDPRLYFTGSVSFEQHLKGQNDNRTRYAASLAALEKSGVSVAQNARVRALGAAWARNDYTLASAFLADRSTFGLVEVVKAITLLDAERQMRVLEKKLRRFELSGSKVSPRKLGKIKSDMDNLAALKPSVGSASGALSKHLKLWTQTLTKEELEFYALFFPAHNWKHLADICHFNPAKDFPALPWFLPYCFGTPAPEDTLVHQCAGLIEENINSFLQEVYIPFSFVKKFKSVLTPESKEVIAKKEKLDTILWWYEDLHCDLVNAVVKQRLNEGETIQLPTGKLMERLLLLKQMENRQQNTQILNDLLPLANKHLSSLQLPLDSPVVVIGDASASMSVAVQTSTIIASLLTAITAAKLVFFNDNNIDAPYLPETIEQVLKLAMETKAQHSTAPAASLWPFYEKKETVKTFIIVTDEEENTSYNNFRSGPLFKKYYYEVYPSKLVFISFLRGQHVEGQMVREMKQVDPKIVPLQFRLDSSRPDLTKLDNLFGLLSSNSLTFKDQIAEMEKEISEKGLESVFKDLSKGIKE